MLQGRFFYDESLSYSGVEMKSKSSVSTRLTFFNDNLSKINVRRIQANRSKGLAKFLTKDAPKRRSLIVIEHPLGIMSFGLYGLRMINTIALLINQSCQVVNASPKSKAKTRDLWYSLLNDSIWFSVNLVEYFWLTFNTSRSAGLRGLQLDTVGQLIDVLILLIRYQQDKKSYLLRCNQAGEEEKMALARNWRLNELHLLRNILTMLAIALTYALFSTSVITVAIAPIISPIVFMGALSRLLIDMTHDSQFLAQLNSSQTLFRLQEQNSRRKARLQDLNQIILSNIFLPMGFFVLISAPLPLALSSCFVMLLLTKLADHFIDAFSSAEEGLLRASLPEGVRA